MKRPAFLFYPGDWRNNAKLRRCSGAARAAWLDVLCVLHDSDEYGLVRWPLSDLANAAGAPMRLIRELVEKDVLKGGDKRVEIALVYTPKTARRDGMPVTLIAEQKGPLWYSSRMVRDEYVRLHRSGFGDDDEAPKPGRLRSPKASPMPPFGEAFSEPNSAGNGDDLSAPNGAGISAPIGAGIGPRTRVGDRARADPSLSSSIANTGIPNTEIQARAPSPGEACKAMKAAGMAVVSPSNPKLIAMLDQGMTVDELSDAARTAVERGKGFAWALERAAGLRADAANVQLAPQSARSNLLSEILKLERPAPENDDDIDDVRARG